MTIPADKTKTKPMQLNLRKLAIFTPLVPVVLGMALKLSLIDDVPRDPALRNKFLMSEYGAPLWLDLLVSAYLLPIAAIMTGVPSGWRRGALYVIPFTAFLLCLLFVLGLPKLGLDQPMWVVWIPDVIAFLCLLVVGLLILDEPR